MKKVFVFNLPEDQEDFEIYNDAVKNYMAIEDLFNEFRNVLKYDSIADIKDYIQNETDEIKKLEIARDNYDSVENIIHYVTSYWRNRLNKILNDE